MEQPVAENPRSSGRKARCSDTVAEFRLGTRSPGHAIQHELEPMYLPFPMASEAANEDSFNKGDTYAQIQNVVDQYEEGQE